MTAQGLPESHRSGLTVGVHDVDWPAYDRPMKFAAMPRVTVAPQDDVLLRAVLHDAYAQLAPELTTPDFDPFKIGFFLAFVPDQTADDYPVKWHFNQWYFGVDAAGYLFNDDRNLARMTVGDLRRSGLSGYIPGNWDRIVVMRPEGLGGGDFVADLADFLTNVGVDLVASGTMLGSGIVVNRFRRRRNDREARRLAAEWVGRGLSDPYFLREWFDRKGLWTTHEVGQRLGLTSSQAGQLLRSAGYEYVADVGRWSIGTTRRAKRRRRRWLENRPR